MQNLTYSLRNKICTWTKNFIYINNPQRNSTSVGLTVQSQSNLELWRVVREQAFPSGICLAPSLNTLDRHFDFDAVHSEKVKFFFLALPLFVLLSLSLLSSCLPTNIT